MTTSDVATERVRGKVRKLKEGYGFISGDDGRDYFFHWTAMQKTTKDFRDLEILDRVDFLGIPAEKPGKFKALEVRVIDDRPK